MHRPQLHGDRYVLLTFDNKSQNHWNTDCHHMAQFKSHDRKAVLFECLTESYSKVKNCGAIYIFGWITHPRRRMISYFWRIFLTPGSRERNN